MKIYQEMSANDFVFWGGAKYTVNELTDEQLNDVWDMLETMYPDGVDETEINDFFWFEEEIIAEWLEFDSFEKLCAYNRGEEDGDNDKDDENDEDEAE